MSLPLLVSFISSLSLHRAGVPLPSKIMDVVAGEGITLSKNIFGSMFNKFTPVSLAMGFKMLKIQYGLFHSHEHVKAPWAVHYRDGIDLMYCYDMEFAFPIDIENPQVLIDAVQVVIDHTEKYALDGGYSTRVIFAIIV